MERKKLVIVGAGGFGREVMWQLADVNSLSDMYDILGFVDDTQQLQGKTINGYPVVGNMEWLIDYREPICAAICIGNSAARKRVYEKISVNSNVQFPSIIAEDVKCSDLVKFGQGCIICLSNILTVNITLGDFVISNLDCTIGHDVVIEDFV
ncbi:MAG: transferase, partial [Oscillospiraceae bacterium]